MSDDTLVPRCPSVPIDFSKPCNRASLRGKSALVTGGATGIGQGCAAGLAAAGAYVTIADVNEKDAKETVEKLTQEGLHVQFVRTDVSSWESLVEAFKAAVAFGPDQTLDIVIPAAGIGGTRLLDWLNDPKVDEGGDPKPVRRRFWM
jgi:5'-hydroxyaverantin dehydrogenase